MKRNRLLVALVALGVGLYAWLVPHSTLASAVPIPQQINAFIEGLIFVAVTAGFVWLFQYVGLDLRDYAAPIAGVLSAFVIGVLQGWVNLIPPEYDTFVTIAFNVIVVILSGIGTLYVAHRLAGQGEHHGLLKS